MRADKKLVQPTLKTAKGQIEAVLKMIDDDRYCIDIINQLLACEALIKKARKEVLKGHINGCVANAFKSSDENERIQKINEIINILEKMQK